jgi:hypothetical protein
MRRLLWLGIGLALGALAFRKLTQMAQKMTPGGMAKSFGAALTELAQAVGDFVADVREAMAEREQTLREGAGLDTAARESAGRHAGSPGGAAVE